MADFFISLLHSIQTYLISESFVGLFLPIVIIGFIILCFVKVFKND